MGERTRIQLCGRLSVELDGVELVQSLRGKQVPLLLAYLVLNRDRPVGREELIGALWPETAPRSQDAAMRTLLSRLRSALGRGIVSGRDELGLSLPEPAWVDIEAAASEVWRAQRGAGLRRRPGGLGAGAGAAQHRQPRAAARHAGVVAGAPPPGAGRHPPAGPGGHRPRRAQSRRHAAGLGGAGRAHPDRLRALPRVGLRAADGGARGSGQRRRGHARVRAAALAAARRARHRAFARGDRGPRAAAQPAGGTPEPDHRRHRRGDRGSRRAGRGRLGPAGRPPGRDGAA